jgi:hypothetical protein
MGLGSFGRCWVSGVGEGFFDAEKCSTESFTAKLAGQVPEAIRGAVAPLFETIDHLNEQIRYYDQMEEQIARERYLKKLECIRRCRSCSQSEIRSALRRAGSGQLFGG